MTVKVLKVNDGEGQVLLTYKRTSAGQDENVFRKHLKIRKYLPESFHGTQRRFECFLW